MMNGRATSISSLSNCKLSRWILFDNQGDRWFWTKIRVDSPDDVAWYPGRGRWSRNHVERVLWIPSFFAVYAIIMETVTSADQEKIYLIWEAV